MNAIILSAGMGTRLLPITETIPKALIRINGVSIVESQILFLRKLGIKDIYVVIGYMHEKFSFLEKEPDVKLIYNDKYSNYNNIYSLFLCRQYLKNTWILDGDVFINKRLVTKLPIQSTYFSIFKSLVEFEWILECSKDDKLKKFLTSDEVSENEVYKDGANVISGISFWNESATQIIKEQLEYYFLDKIPENISKGASLFWDQIIKDNLSLLNISVKRLKHGDCFEIDSQVDWNHAKSCIELDKKFKALF